MLEKPMSDPFSLSFCFCLVDRMEALGFCSSVLAACLLACCYAPCHDDHKQALNSMLSFISYLGHGFSSQQ